MFDVPMSSSHPLDSASFLSFATFAWMTPMMWRMFKNRQDDESLHLSPHDAAETSSGRSDSIGVSRSHTQEKFSLSKPDPCALLCRLYRLWEEEVEKVGQENASLVKVILRFQRTRMIASVLVGILAMVAVFVGPVISFSFFFFLILI